MTPPLDESRSAAWRIFLTAHALLNELIEQELAQAGLPPMAWYDVLFVLSSSPDRRLRMHKLADAIILRRSNLTRLVDRLEASGLVCRKTCASDRRGAFAEITEEGLAMRQRMWPVYAQAIAKYFAIHLSDAEVETIIHALGRVIAAARKA